MEEGGRGVKEDWRLHLDLGVNLLFLYKALLGILHELSKLPQIT